MQLFACKILEVYFFLFEEISLFSGIVLEGNKEGDKGKFPTRLCF